MNLNMQKKARRIQEGQPPRVLDIFSGCGGISLGFHAAGFRIDANVEIDPDAAASHAFNFHPGHPGARTTRRRGTSRRPCHTNWQRNWACWRMASRWRRPST
ncbi:DNA cytosine methyltransferase [Deinococcus aquaticus]|uniref:DNA cytosine methyltransferase n=1 Tax=Deinococcus aquaticus TaxID=328692 RepID=UPI003623B0F5